MDHSHPVPQDDPGPAQAQDAHSHTYTGQDDTKPSSSSGWPSDYSAVDAAYATTVSKKEKGRVRFNSNAAASTLLDIPHVAGSTSPQHAQHRNASPARPRLSALRSGSTGSIPTITQFQGDDANTASEKAISAVAAQERAQQVAEKLQRGSPTASRNSLEDYPDYPSIASGDGSPFDPDMGIALHNMVSRGRSRGESQHDTSSWGQAQEVGEDPTARNEAQDLVRTHIKYFAKKTEELPEQSRKINVEDYVVPSEHNGGFYDGVYNVPPPENYRGGVLSQLLKLYKPSEVTGSSGHPFLGHRHQRSLSTGAHTSASESGSATPVRKKWYEQNRSQETLANLVEASARLANPNTGNQDDKNKKKRPLHKRAGSASRLSTLLQKEQARITVHIAETLARQGYLIKLCRALMLYGAPTHRLEEYLSMSARVLEIEGQFLYLPGCMIISFDDKSTHTTEVRIVRVSQGIDLGRLKDVHQIYKEVMHDVIGVEEGTERLEALLSKKDKFSPWLRVLIFGLTSATAAPFSFKARLIDLPLTFCFGCVVGLLQLIVAPMSNLYNNVFEVTATILISFLARAFGSIRGGDLFCFSALAQSGIVMLLPGYSVLCSSLELQSRAIVPGSIRIVYAIIYSLLLGFGITIGAALWGLFDSNATSETQCHNPLDPYYGFIFVPPFILCISIIYQAKWQQMPVMVVIAFAGYIVNYFSGIRISASPQVANTLGAFCVGVLANLYSRLRHGVAAATLIPAIFVQVPGGLASTGGLLSGIRTANLLTNSSHASNSTDSQTNTGELSSVVFNVAGSMIQIAIGIAVGLFISALIVYPLGKRRSGLFSF